MTVARDVLTRELAALFDIEELVSEGPRSVVYFACDRETGIPLALKAVARLSPVSAEKARIVAQLEHPHIVRLLRHGAAESFLWYATQRVTGVSLAERVATEGRLDLAETLRVVQQVASALDYAHRRGVTHGGLTARDILLDDAGWARLVDLAVPHGLTAGRTADDHAALADVVRECLHDQIPATVAAAIARATAPRPGDRFAGVLDFVAALSGNAPVRSPQWFAERPTPSPAGTKPPPVLFIDDNELPRPPRWRRPLVVASIVVAVVGVGTAFVKNRSEARSSSVS